MRIVVVGGTGQVGSKLVKTLIADGHQAVAAAPSAGVDSVTGEGLAAALAGASAVVDVSNSPSTEDEAAMEFFHRSTTHLLDAGADARVGHHVVLSVVGTDRLAPQGGYFRAKSTQEELVAAGPIPYTIVRATQFFEFLSGILESSTVDGQVRVAPVLLQPVAAEAVARLIADAALAPASGVIELAGPERAPLAEFLERVLADGDVPLPVIVDDSVGYFGRAVEQTSLVPVGDAVIDPLTFDRWKAAQPH